MKGIPNWFETTYSELATQKPCEAMILEKTFPPVEALWGELNGKLRGVFLPNALEHEGRSIGEDPKTPVSPWVANFLGNFATRFSVLPERANRAVEQNLLNRESELTNRAADDEWKLGKTMTNFGNRFNPKYVIQMEKAFNGRMMDVRLPLAQSIVAWPSLDLRTFGDLHRHLHKTLEELDLQGEFERLKSLDDGSNFNNAVARPLFPVMLGMLEKGVPLYPTLIA